jgi:hypothetical protein
MALSSQQVTLTASTITDLLATAGFKKVGSVTDPLPIQFMITAGTCWWGGSNVSAANGFLMVVNSPVVLNVYSNDYPFVFSTGTPLVYLVVGRQ